VSDRIGWQPEPGNVPMIVICMLATFGAFTVLFAVAWVVREFWRINRGGTR
jgi:hypothetical protein